MSIRRRLVRFWRAAVPLSWWSQSGDPNNPDRFYAGGRPGSDWSRQQSQPTRGNLTGIDALLARVAGKRLELLLERAPAAKSIAYLCNPTNPVFTQSETKEVEVAANAHGVRLLSINASGASEIETAFADLASRCQQFCVPDKWSYRS
jgi:ABC-type uncharacterized transport system substrate-binding protein